MSDFKQTLALVEALLAAMMARVREVSFNCSARFKDSAPLHIVTRPDMVAGVRIPGGFCWTSTLHPKCSVRFIGRGDGTTPTLQPLRCFIQPILWELEEFEAFLHVHQQPEDAIVQQMRSADEYFATLYPSAVTRVLDCMSSTCQPMTLLALGIQAMEQESFYLEQKRKGEAGADQMLALSMVDAQMSRPWIVRLVAEIYYRCQGKQVPERVSKWEAGASWVKNLARMLGGGEDMEKWLHLYMITNSDNEGGNASMHAARLTSSTEASFFAAAASCCQALSGRRHGDAVADAYSFMKSVYPDLKEMSEDEIASYMVDRKASDRGFRWPGLGHGVFQVPDERFLLQCEYAKCAGLNNDFLPFMMRVAKAGSKTFSKPGKLVFPNVDFASGAIHSHFFGDSPAVMEWYTCLFLLSRLIGARAQTTAERGLGLPIERPSTLSLVEMMGLEVPDQEVLDLSGL